MKSLAKRGSSRRLNLHANITAKMAHHSDVIIGFDTYPHVDCYERGFEAGQLLFGMNEGKIQPNMAYRQLPLLTAPPAQCTMKAPMTEVVKALHALETESGVVTATLSMGFPFADITDAGVSVLVTTNGDMALAETYADQFASDIWEMRERFTFNLHTVESAIEIANQTDGKPIVLADGADNPGGGGSLRRYKQSYRNSWKPTFKMRSSQLSRIPNPLPKQLRQVSETTSNCTSVGRRIRNTGHPSH